MEEREREREREAAEKVHVGFGTPQKVVRGKEVRTDNRSSSQNLSALSFPPSPSLLPPRKKMCPNERHVWGLSSDGGSSGGGGMRRRDMKMVKPLYLTLPSCMANIRKKGMCLRLFHRQPEAGT